jgi:hypothetical protein
MGQSAWRSAITWIAESLNEILNGHRPLRLFDRHPANFTSLKRFSPSICSILSSCYRSGCSRSYVNPHHLCTDTAALYTAVSEVAFLVQNRLSPYITFYRLLSVSRFVTEDTLFTLKHASIFDSALLSVAVDHQVNKSLLQPIPPQLPLLCIRNPRPPVVFPPP